MASIPTPSEIRPTDTVYRPYGASRQLWHCRDQRILIEGPAGTGKTRGTLQKIVGMAEQYPNSRHWIGRKTRTSMTESVLVTLEEKVLPVDHPARQGPGRAHRHSYVFPNGSSIIVGGLDTPERTFSSEYDTLTVFEGIEIDQNEWELLQRVLRNGKMPYTQAIVDTNPGPTGHWLNRLANEGYFTRLLSRHVDNPFLWDHRLNTPTAQGAKYLATLDALTGHRRARLRDGRWVSSEGNVYPEFDAAIHVVDAMPKGWEKWPKRRSIDMGFVDPFVCQWWAGQDDRWYLYREIYKSGRIIEDHARDIVRLSAGERYEETVADHDREDRETLHRHGVETTPATKDIELGIDAVKTRLARGDNLYPRLHFLRGATSETDQTLVDAKRPASTLEEFDCYMWKAHRDGIAKDEPVDRDNHGMDAMRYFVMSLQGGGFGVWTAG